MPAHRCRRVFILGAGFSKAVGMPLSTELTSKLIEATIYPDDDDKMEWLKDLKDRLK